MARLRRFSVVLLFASAAITCLPGAARATELAPQPSQLTVDVDVASAGVTYARRLGSGSVLLGGGGALGLSPILGTTIATGSHFDPAPNVNLLEVVSAQVFARFELTSWLRADAGVRGALFAHGGENYTGGQFAGVFVAPALAWRWLWVGPRVSAGFLSEGSGESAWGLTFDYVMLRFVKSW